MLNRQFLLNVKLCELQMVEFKITTFNLTMDIFIQLYSLKLKHVIKLNIIAISKILANITEMQDGFIRFLFIFFFFGEVKLQTFDRWPTNSMVQANLIFM